MLTLYIVFALTSKDTIGMEEEKENNEVSILRV